MYGGRTPTLLAGDIPYPQTPRMAPPTLGAQAGSRRPCASPQRKFTPHIKAVNIKFTHSMFTLNK